MQSNSGASAPTKASHTASQVQEERLNHDHDPAIRGQQDNEDPDDPLILLLFSALPGAGKSTLAHTLESTGDWIRASQDDAPRRRRQEAEDQVRQGLRRLSPRRAAGNSFGGDSKTGAASNMNVSASAEDGRTLIGTTARPRRGVIVDRCGFDAAQRAYFTRIAQEPEFIALGIQVWCLVMIVPYDILLHRLLNRPPHPTLPASDATRVLNITSRGFRPPIASLSEGFNRILEIRWRPGNPGQAQDWGTKPHMEGERGTDITDEGGWTVDEAVNLVNRIGKSGRIETRTASTSASSIQPGWGPPSRGRGSDAYRGGGWGEGGYGSQRQREAIATEDSEASFHGGHAAGGVEQYPLQRRVNQSSNGRGSNQYRPGRPLEQGQEFSTRNLALNRYNSDQSAGVILRGGRGGSGGYGGGYRGQQPWGHSRFGADPSSPTPPYPMPATEQAPGLSSAGNATRAYNTNNWRRGA